MKSNKNNPSIHPASEHTSFPKPWALLLSMFFLNIAARFTLAFFFRHGPNVQIDESLYINIAKSLAAGEGIAYRSQPVPYMYIFYPLLLVPLYLFPLPFDLYRVIQLYNAVLISTSVFPVYLFAKDFTGDKRKALLASTLTLLMPDMKMADFLMAESAIWPLSLWLVFFSCRLFLSDEKRFFNGIMAGIFTALLFWAKPGAVAMGFILLLSAAFLGEKSQLQKRRSAALVGLSVCISLIILFYILYVFVFGYTPSLLGLYGKQLTVVSAKWFAAVIEFSFLQLLLFAVACAGFFFVLPCVCLRMFDENRKLFLSAFLLGLVVTAVGTAALVDMFMWNGSFTNPQLHLRYMAMYVPVMVVFSLGAYWPMGKNKPLLLALAAMAALTVFPGASVGFVKDTSTYIDSLALSAWINNFNVPAVVGILLTVVVVLFLAWVSLQIFRGHTSSLLKQGLLFFSLFLLCNNICGYIACNIHKDTDNYGQDAMQMNTVLEALPQEVLIITQQNYDETVSYLLESRIRKPYQQVTVDAFMEALSNNNGVYTPFIPADQDPNVGNHSTPDTDTFLFGLTVTDHLEVSKNADLLKSSPGGWFKLAQISEGSRIVDTMLANLDMNTLHEGEQAQLYVFDTSRYKNGKLTLHLYACASEESADLEILNAGKIQTVPLSEKYKTCLISLREGDAFLTARNGDIIISSYTTD